MSQKPMTTTDKTNTATTTDKTTTTGTKTKMAAKTGKNADGQLTIEPAQPAKATTKKS